MEVEMDRGSGPHDEDSGHSGGDRALDDGAICELFGISKPTVVRWRNAHDFPMPDFYVGPRPFTWQSRVLDWARKQPSISPIGKRPMPPRG
jgi:hypothetical protein